MEPTIFHLPEDGTPEKLSGLPINQRLRLTNRSGSTAFWLICPTDEDVDPANYRNDPRIRILHPSRSFGFVILEDESIHIAVTDIGARIEIEDDNPAKGRDVRYWR